MVRGKKYHELRNKNLFSKESDGLSSKCRWLIFKTNKGCVLKFRRKDRTVVLSICASEIVTAIIINVARWKACHLIGINPRECGSIETWFHTISIPRAEYA